MFLKCGLNHNLYKWIVRLNKEPPNLYSMKLLLENSKMSFVQRFLKNESGATAVEYGLIAALIGVVIIAGAGALGTALNAKFVAIGTTVTNAGS